MYKYFLLAFLTMTAGAQTLTFTVNNLKVHQGDKVPPCTYKVTGYVGTDTWTQATAGNTGYPTCSTTYTPASGTGSYSYTISTSAVTFAGSYTAATVAGTITVIPATGNGVQNITNVVMPAGMMPNMTVANSACSGVTAGLGDAGATTTTTNMNCFLTTGRSSPLTFGNTPKHFYLPCGVYTVNSPIVFVGAAQDITGDGPDCTVIKLAQSTSTFSNAAAPVDFFNFEGAGASGAFNNGFNEYMANLSVEIGPGNPGANAINFIGSNFDSVRNVWSYFDDSLGACGLCMNHSYPGETLVKDYAGYGGGQCYRATQEGQYNTAIEDMTCENQSVNAIWTGVYNLEVSNYFSFQSTTPAWTNLTAGEVLINGEFYGTGSGTALVNSGAAASMYVRNVTTSGYTNAMTDANGGATLTGNITEHFSGTPSTLWSTIPPTGIIITPVLETPLASDPASSGWLAANPDTSTWSAQMATCPASGVFYIPVLHNYPNETVSTSNDASFTGVYTPTPTGAVNMTAPSCINHIIWNHATFPSGGVHFPVITTTGTSATPLIIDGIGGADTKVIVQNSARTVVMEDGAVNYICTANNNVFFEDIETENDTVFCNNQNIFARALDNESLGGDFGITTIAYVAATNTITVGVASVDPLIVPGGLVYFNQSALGVQPSTWVWNTTFQVTNIVTSPCCTLTGTWLGSHADQATTTQTQGSYRAMPNHVECTGCNLWILGYKTEDAGPLVNITSGQVEIDGGFWYPLRPQFPGTAAFYLADSNAFFTGQILASSEFSWNNFVNESKSGVLRQLANPNTGNPTGTTLLNGFYSLGAVSAPANGKIYKGKPYKGMIF